MKLKRFFDYLRPPKPWFFFVNGLLAVSLGVVAYLFYVSKAWSYLSDDPETCVNCHIMAPQYATWQHNVHRLTATCNDCHVPHDNVFSHYYFKAKDGLRHATIFTLRNEPQVIKIKEAGIKVVQENCKRCHTQLNEKVGILQVTLENSEHGEGKLCWECHRETPHGKVRSLSSTPATLVPLPESPVPGWLKQLHRRQE
ncbi:MAG: cytochrome c nitrite reductase small subunit [Candidatus Cyclobacteriaceae bacterium M3_2C_046]